MTSHIAFERLSVRSFRNLISVDVEPSPRLNVITGDNGHGKTSLIEALYFVATSHSFRASRLSEIVTQGAELSSVRATLREGEQRREQRAAIDHGKRALTIDGKRPGRLAAYATKTPIVVFHPGDLELVSGSAASRRLLLDRLALFIEPASVDDRQRYLLALRQRQRALEERGPMSSEVDAFEAIAAEHGARLTRARHAAAAELRDELARSFRAVAPTELELADRYVPGGTIDPAEFRTELARRRAIDARRGLATFGPQRDEIELELAGRSARHHASQGQQRILTLALKLAELASIRRARGAHPVLLLDDVSSELDPRRTGAVYELVSAADSQVFVTTARRDLLERAALETSERADFGIENGVLERL